MAQSVFQARLAADYVFPSGTELPCSVSEFCQAAEAPGFGFAPTVIAKVDLKDFIVFEVIPCAYIFEVFCV